MNYNSNSIIPKTYNNIDSCLLNTEPINKYENLFEPIYRRQGRHFVPAGHKIIVRSERSAENTFKRTQENADQSSVELVQAMEMGINQIDIVRSQIDLFLQHKLGQRQQKLVFEISLSDLEQNQNNLCLLSDVLLETASKGLKARDIVVELAEMEGLDPGVVYSIAMKLKEIGVLIALTNLDADGFSFKRIFQVRPNVVKFNRSWCDLAIKDSHYVRSVESLVAGIHAMGIFTNLTSVKNKDELLFATLCKFTRCQGAIFGEPTPTMVKGPIFSA